MIEPDYLRFDTLSLHAGQQPDPTTGARAVPLYFTTSYVFDDSDHAAGLFNLEMPGHLYTRLTNPTVAVLEERLAAAEERMETKQVVDRIAKADGETQTDHDAAVAQPATPGAHQRQVRSWLFMGKGEGGPGAAHQPGLLRKRMTVRRP